ncbi:MAG: M48 family metalloprotease [Elusimicrobiota bacterium]
MLFSKTLKSSIAIILSTLILALAPGIGTYEALANTISMQVGAGVQTVPGGVAGAGLAGLGTLQGSNGLNLTPSQVSLTGSLKSLPSVQPVAASPAVMMQAPALSPVVQGRAVGVQSAVHAPHASPRTAQYGAASAGAAAPTLKQVLSQSKEVVLPAAQIAEMPASEAHGAGVRIMDLILGRRAHDSGAAAVAMPSSVNPALRQGLRAAALDMPALSETKAQTLDPADVLFYTQTQDTIGRYLDEVVRENSGWWKRFTGAQRLMELAAQAFRQELRKGNKPAFEITVTEDGVKKHLRGPNGESIAELMWSQLKRSTGLTEAELSRFLDIANRIQAGPAKSAAKGVMASVILPDMGAAASEIQTAQASLAYSSLGLTPVDDAQAPRSVLSKTLKFVVSAARMAAAAGAAYGLHTLAASLAPALFGFLPIAAVWAVSSGIVLLPAALYARYRLSLRDSPRLRGVKLALDLAMGAFLGAMAVAAPAFASGLAFDKLVMTLPLVAATSFAAAQFGRQFGGTGGILDKILTFASLHLPAALVGAAAAAPLTLGGIFGLMALPAMTTISFFLGRIIASAESGRPFSVPGSAQKIRFPAYTWVMTGVVFALLTGYTPVWTNWAFAAWMILGQSKYFDGLYLGALGWAAMTGFAAPISFLVIAFAPERAATWTEKLLGLLLRAGPAAPSTRAEPVKYNEDQPERWPQFHHWLKTGLLLGGIAAFGWGLAFTVFGVKSFLMNFGIAAALSTLPLLISKWIIKKTMQATPMDEQQDPEVFGMTRELVGRINAERAKQGKAPIPMPEMVNVPMPVPNAFATGITPFHAMVGVTNEMKDMTLNPERTREMLIRMLAEVEPQGKSFRVYRKAIRGSISGIAEGADPEEVIAAVQRAPAAEIKALGVRALRGVIGHELSHVMHRDMILGAVAGSMASAIAFSSYGVLWAVGHAKRLLNALWRKLFGRAEAPKEETPAPAFPAAEDDASGRVKPMVVEPVSATAAAAAVISLAKIFAALWAPILGTILQMGSSRVREGHADEGGALLSGDPESLALGLGLLTSWRPRPGAIIESRLLPLLASQAHVMTVNPLEQLRRAGRLGLDRSPRWAVGKEDDFFFNLFITHPDTTMRIERLHDMAEALERVLRRR